ncbi:hypothetical protein PNEG_03566 [Pneumocystis murina B123]|uniref:Monopolin complex subunit Csm1/Pcs1 C-terminal domain-containing protein n=1 Tax=Pneumocystis murina (strain B123) TaxID=1069680 RepID=M7NHT3_PNEMU|nr:hypothetical protein PNEG_03566 [Pneumocystis murina B123]EMR08128.1 hypothetical protein PNEG_03566 [Pneumocystis murina B123]
MRKKHTNISKNKERKHTIDCDFSFNEQDDSIDELASSLKSKRNHTNKETPLRKISNIGKFDLSEKENIFSRYSETIEANSCKKRFEKGTTLENNSKGSQKHVQQEVLQIRQNDSKRKFLDIYDENIDMEKRLEETIRKMEEFEEKYNCLKNLRQTEVESNFLAYQEIAESRFKASQALIDSLTKDMDIKDKRLNELSSCLVDLKAQKKEFEKISENLKSTEQALNHAKSQISYLNTKLSSRSKLSMVQLKEELYSDLTGLLIRDVKSDSKKTVFDCLQTGRNGTLHFKLSLFSDPSSHLHERFSYTPLFDQERDAFLLNCLPEYLTDEIIFEKDQAAMFSWRLSSALQKKD